MGEVEKAAATLRGVLGEFPNCGCAECEAERKEYVAALAVLGGAAGQRKDLAEALAFVMREYNVPNAKLTREQNAALAEGVRSGS